MKQAITIAVSSRSCQTTELTKALKAAIKEKYPNASFTEVKVKAREGREDCGAGALHVTVECKFWAYSWVEGSVTENRSQWRNFGFPSGTRYDYDLDLEFRSGH